MRPLGPLPWTCARATPSSRANLRTDGLAWGLAPVSSCGSLGTGAEAGAAVAAFCAAGAGAWAAAGGGAAAVCGGDAAPELVDKKRIGGAFDTLSATFI